VMGFDGSIDNVCNLDMIHQHQYSFVCVCVCVCIIVRYVLITLNHSVCGCER
jgi:hypothetical protein